MNMRLVTLALVTVAVAACDPIVASEIMLTPSPGPAGASMPSRVLTLVDSLARRRGLTSQRASDPCTIGTSAGTRAGAWEGRQLWMSVCVERTRPDRIQ